MFKIGNRVMMEKSMRKQYFPNLQSYTGTVIKVYLGEWIKIQRDYIRQPEIWSNSYWVRKRGGTTLRDPNFWRYLHGLKEI